MSFISILFSCYVLSLKTRVFKASRYRNGVILIESYSLLCHFHRVAMLRSTSLRRRNFRTLLSKQIFRSLLTKISSRESWLPLDPSNSSLLSSTVKWVGLINLIRCVLNIYIIYLHMLVIIWRDFYCITFRNRSFKALFVLVQCVIIVICCLHFDILDAFLPHVNFFYFFCFLMLFFFLSRALIPGWVKTAARFLALKTTLLATFRRANYQATTSLTPSTTELPVRESSDRWTMSLPTPSLRVMPF